MTNSLASVLLHFRQGTIGIAADIEGMFHQICVQEGETGFIEVSMVDK